MKEKLQKSVKQMNTTIEQIADKSKKVVIDTKENMHTFALKMQDENIKAQLRKYNPVFPEEYMSKDFSLPNMIVIVDDAERKGIEVCKGAIGWKSKRNGMEVFHLYDEAIEFSGLKFVPVASCYSIYYMDKFDRRKFVNLSEYFERMFKSKLSELEHIAFSLRAKRYTVEVQKSTLKELNVKGHRKFGARLPDEFLEETLIAANSSAEAGIVANRILTQNIHKSAVFDSNDKPVMPNLRWFKYDDEINNLVDMRLSGQIVDNSMREYKLILNDSSSSSIDINAAAKIDGALSKLGVNMDHSILGQAKKESNRKLIYKIEF